MRLRRMNQLSISSHLFLLFFISLCIPFLIFGLIWYNISSDSIKQNARNYNGQLVQQVLERIDTYFTDIERMTLPVLTQPTIQQFLRLEKEQKYERIKISKNIETQVFSNLTFGRDEISNVTVYSKQGIATTMRGSFIYIYKDIFQNYMESTNGHENFQIRGMRSDEGQPVIAVTRNLIDTTSYTLSGIMVMDLKLSILSEIAANIQPGTNGYIWIVDQYGNIVYHPDRDKWGKGVDSANIDVLITEKEDTSTRHLDVEGQLLTYRHSPYSNLTVVSQVPVEELNGELTSLRNVNITGALGMIIVALLGVGSYSMFLTRSILTLKKLMKRVEDGDLEVQAPIVNTREIGSLYKSFNHMVKEIKRLILVVHRSEMKEKQMQIKQRESSLQAMQSQINPHFLYNTLEVINSYAIVEGVMPISRMATAMADVFRYSVGNSGQMVTMKDELDHVRTYFMIQQQRYKDLQIEIQVQPEALLAKVKALRLILQPVVENMFIHGYEKQMLKATYIGVFDEISNGMYTMHVKDHGGGMSEQLRTKYNEIFRDKIEMEDSETIEGSPDKQSRIGLRNVHYRLSLTFGQGYGLYIRESNDKGTWIELRLPFEENSLAD